MEVTNVDARDLCWQLMLADTEDDVVAILREAGLWDDPQFWRHLTEETALAIVRPDADDDDVFDFFVNVDNKYVRAVQKDSKDDPKLLEEKFVYSMVLVGLALVMDHNTKTADRRDAGPEESIEGLVSRVTSKLAPVILPMVDVVGGLSLESLHDDE
jgi:hypothetical protein